MNNGQGVHIGVEDDQLILTVDIGEHDPKVYAMAFKLEQAVSLLELVKAGVDILYERQRQGGDPYAETMRRQIERERS